MAAPRDRVFELVATPAEHHRFDASGMVGRPVRPTRVTRAGEIFTMEMTYRGDAAIEEYRTDNHVTAFEEGCVVEWAVAPAGGEPLGWRWRYEFAAVGPSRTIVTLTYDWTGTPDANVRRFGVPLFDEDQLADSLRMLAAAAAEGDAACQTP